MDSTSPQYLVTEITDIKATVRNFQLGLPWITLLGLTSVSWSGALAWTYISSTQASIRGDQTTAGTGYLQVGTRVRAFVTAGTIYGYVTALSVGGGPITTVTFKWDNNGALDSGLTDIQTAGDIEFNETPVTLRHRYRTTDQAITNLNVNDDTLIFAINKSEVWQFEFTLYCDLNTGGGGSVIITPSVPSGATYRIGNYNNLVGWSTTTLNVFASGGNFIQLVMTVTNGTTAGNVTIGYTGQGPVIGTNVKALSTLRAMRYF
jgi:hypothetical protein